MARSTDPHVGTLLGSFVEDMKRKVRSKVEAFFASQELPLTDNEFIQAFIQREHVPVLIQVRQLCGDIGAERYVYSRIDERHRAVIKIETDDTLPVPVPDYTLKGLSPDCPEPLRQRIIEWVEPRLEMGDMIGDLLDVMTVYNKMLPNLRTFAIMLPSLPTMIQITDRNKLAKFSSKLNKGDFMLPRLPPEVAARVQQVSSLFLNINMVTDMPKVKGIRLSRAQLYEDHRRKHIFADIEPFKSRMFLGSGSSI